MIQWLNPLLLLGLGGAIVPLVIHLIQRKRAPQHEFPAVQLLLSARRRIKKRIQLRHILVMLLRILFILLLAAALARPYLRYEQGLGLTENPTACLIVLDDTLSMRYRPGATGESMFDRARQSAREVLQQLREFDRARVITFSGQPVGPSRFTGEHDVLEEPIGEKTAGFGGGSAADVLDRARRVLADAELEEKRLVVLSDLTRSSWKQNDFDRLGQVDTSVRVPDLWEGGPPPANRRIQGAEWNAEEGRLTVEFNVTIDGEPEPTDTPVKLFVGKDRRAAKALAAGRQPDKFRLEAELDGREFTGRVELPEDGLPADNVHHLAGRSGVGLRTLLVDGDPRESIYSSESFYLDLALGGGEAGLRNQTIPRDALTEEDLRNYDCVILANVPAEFLPPQNRLSRYVREGGALWFILGDQNRAGALRRKAGRVLPALPRQMQGVEADRGDAVHLLTGSLSHRIFDALEPRWRTRFGRANFRRWWLTQPRPNSRTLMRLQGDVPILMERNAGDGRVLLMTSALDRDWNDLCIQPVFVPFVHQTIQYMTGSLGMAESRSLMVGEAFRQTVPGQVPHLYVRSPDSDRWQQVPTRPSDGESQLVYEGTPTPGVYAVARQEDGAGRVGTFAVNIDPADGNLRRLPRAVVDKRLVESAGGAEREGGRAAGRPLWALLLWAALAVLLIESILARR